MAESDEIPQDQEQPEPQPPGGAGDLISLDQAREAALGHARDNRALYGRRYEKQELAWEVLDQEEQENSYYLRLSYQPASGFRGVPGIEEFNIEKTGPVRSRRIVSEPVRRGGALGCSLVAVGALVPLIAIAGGLLAYGI